jgi:hypothetical protein
MLVSNCCRKAPLLDPAPGGPILVPVVRRNRRPSSSARLLPFAGGTVEGVRGDLFDVQSRREGLMTGEKSIMSPARWLNGWLEKASDKDRIAHTEAIRFFTGRDGVLSMRQAAYFAAVGCTRWQSTEAYAAAVAIGVIAGADLVDVNLDTPEFRARFNLDLRTLHAQRFLSEVEPAGNA